MPRKSSYPRKTRDGRWLIRWRDGEHHRQATFDTQREAREYLARVTVSRSRGEAFDASRGKITVNDYWPKFLDGFDEPPRPTMLALYRTHFELYIGGASASARALPRDEKLGHVPLNALTSERIAAWRSAMRTRGAGESTIEHVTRLLRTILNRAVDEERIAKSPARTIRNRTPKPAPARALELEEVRALADAHPDHLRAAVYVMAFRGLRIGELAALRVAVLDLMRGELRIDETLVEVDGRVVIGPPKTQESRRTISLPAFLRDILVQHVARHSDPKDPSAFVFAGERGRPLRPGNYRSRHFQPAAVAAGLGEYVADGTGKHWRGITPHNLRDTAATLALSAGADVVEVARMLGHADPAVTLRRYAGVLESLRSATNDRLDAMFRAAAVEADATVVEIAR